MKTAKRFTLIELRASVNDVVAMQPALKKTGWCIYTGRFTYMPFFDWECQDGAYTRMYYYNDGSAFNYRKNSSGPPSQ